MGELELLPLSKPNERNYTMTKQENQRKNKIIYLFQQVGQPRSAYHELQLMDEEQQRYVEHILTTINEKGYMPA